MSENRKFCGIRWFCCCCRSRSSDGKGDNTGERQRLLPESETSPTYTQQLERVRQDLNTQDAYPDSAAFAYNEATSEQGIQQHNDLSNHIGNLEYCVSKLAQDCLSEMPFEKQIDWQDRKKLNFVEMMGSNSEGNITILNTCTPVVLRNIEYRYGLLDELISNECLNERMIEDINRLSNPYDGKKKLISYINQLNMEKFHMGLRKSHQEHISTYISKAGERGSICEDWPIDDVQLKWITKMYGVFVREIHKGLYDDLVSVGCISELHKCSIESQQAPADKNRELLNIITRRSALHLAAFLKCLETDHSHLISILNKVKDFGDTVLITCVSENSWQDTSLQTIQEKLETAVKLCDETQALKNESESREMTLSEIINTRENLYIIVDAKAEIKTDDQEKLFHSQATSLINNMLNCGDNASDDYSVTISLENMNENLVKTPSENQIDDDHVVVADRIISFVCNGCTSSKEISSEVVKTIMGLGVVNNELFVVQFGQSQVNVYDSHTLTSSRDINIPDMKSPQGLAGCSHNKALYISDRGLNCIHRVDLTNNSISRWTMGEGYSPHGLSVTAEHNLLVTARIRGTLGECVVVEYTSEGQQVREIRLDRSIMYAYQTVQVSSNQFIMCHGHNNSSLHRVCQINAEGQIIKSYGREGGRGEGQLSTFSSLTIDINSKHVFLADWGNHRILLFDPDLTYRGQVHTLRDLEYPYSLYFDSSTDGLFVGEHGSGRVIVISPTV